ncbi:TlpA family protein disulfide reductase [Paenibacillus agaridevorans]|uniref:TlpA family protein disulfide reductase n=1 Tax=Paenibacillus agaridevorans TaxID=171404 RepID=UPI001BE42F82|nr:TlpA disulfide reductase family protein [Paenibacillus agaridevorans]
MKRRQTLITLTIAAAAVAFILYVGLANWGGKAETVQASSIQLQELGSEQQVTVDFAEKPTVISLFTSWCTYCNEDAPKMAVLHEKYKDRLNLIGVNITNRDKLSEVRSYVERHNLSYPILLDRDGSVYSQYGGSGFPALYFVNKAGEVIDAIIGSTDLETLEGHFARLANAP